MLHPTDIAPILPESAGNNACYFSSSSTGNSDYFAANNNCSEPVDFFSYDISSSSDIHPDDNDVRLPQGWKVTGRKQSIFELETNIHTLGELYATLISLRSQLSDPIALEVEEPFNKNAPCFLRTRSSTTDENNITFSTSRSGSSNDFSLLTASSRPSPGNDSRRSLEDYALYDQLLSTYPEFIFKSLIEVYADCICYVRTQPTKLQKLYRQNQLNKAHACAIYAYGSLHALLCHPEKFGIYPFMNQLASDAYQVAFDLVEFDSMDKVTIETLVIMYQYLILLGNDGEARNLFCVAQRQMELFLADNERKKEDTGQDVHRLHVWMAELDWSFSLAKFSAPFIEYHRVKSSLDLIKPVGSSNYQNDRLYVKAIKFKIKGLHILLSADDDTTTDLKPHQRLNDWRTHYLHTFLYKRDPTKSYTVEDKEALRLHALYFAGMLELHQQYMMNGFQSAKIWESRDQWTDYFGQSEYLEITTEQNQVEKGLYRCMNAAYGFIQVIQLLLEEQDRCTLPQVRLLLANLISVLQEAHVYPIHR